MAKPNNLITRAFLSTLADCLDSSPAPLKALRAEREGLLAVEHEIGQLLEAENLHRENAQTRERIAKLKDQLRQCTSPRVIEWAEGRGWLPQPAPDWLIDFWNCGVLPGTCVSHDIEHYR